jgi:RimJ/RimL family protein N-acetyltransferase
LRFPGQPTGVGERAPDLVWTVPVYRLDIVRRSEITPCRARWCGEIAMHCNPPASKSPVTLRPATQADFIAMFGAPPQHRARALAAEIDGRLVGLGGLALVTPGESDACEFWVCFMRATDELRARPVALHRAGLRMIDEAKRLGIRRLVALAEPGIEPAERWLRRFGFAPEEVNGEIIFVRNRKA